MIAVALAVTVGRQGPCALYWMAMVPAAMLEIIMGMKSAETRLGPRSLRRLLCSTKVDMPPMPLPT